jgi:hypothetical protein
MKIDGIHESDKKKKKKVALGLDNMNKNSIE